MMRVFLTSLTLILFSGCATTPSGVVYDSPIGVWTERLDDGSGSMRTTKVHLVDETMGTYTQPYPGRLEFFSTEDDRVWKAYWINDNPGNQTCAAEKGGSPTWGVSIFRFNETYNRYSGTWDFCGEGITYPVSGVR